MAAPPRPTPCDYGSTQLQAPSRGAGWSLSHNAAFASGCSRPEPVLAESANERLLLPNPVIREWSLGATFEDRAVGQSGTAGNKASLPIAGVAVLTSS